MNRDAAAAARFAPVGDVHYRRFDDELILLDLRAGHYFALDAIGARMWQALVVGKNALEVAAELVREYEVDEDVLARDCAALAEDLVDRGLLRRSEP